MRRVREMFFRRIIVNLFLLALGAICISSCAAPGRYVDIERYIDVPAKTEAADIHPVLRETAPQKKSDKAHAP
ncbi:MAG: hypothetical protein NUW37_06045 [Planctomycetes bacterium]|nr:hypothetical protein [Planctomycetota bacterium]